MRNVCVSSFLALLISFAPSLAAQTTGTATPPAPSREKIRKLLEVTGAANIGAQMVDQMFTSFEQSLPTVPREFWSATKAKFKTSEMLDMVIPVYEKHLTEADVDALITFFSSPAGRRFVEKQPLILADSMKIGEEWGERIAGEVLEELKKKGFGPEGQ